MARAAYLNLDFYCSKEDLRQLSQKMAANDRESCAEEKAAQYNSSGRGVKYASVLRLINPKCAITSCINMHNKCNAPYELSYGIWRTSLHCDAETSLIDKALNELPNLLNGGKYFVHLQLHDSSRRCCEKEVFRLYQQNAESLDGTAAERESYTLIEPSERDNRFYAPNFFASELDRAKSICYRVLRGQQTAPNGAYIQSMAMDNDVAFLERYAEEHPTAFYQGNGIDLYKVFKAKGYDAFLTLLRLDNGGSTKNPGEVFAHFCKENDCEAVRTLLKYLSIRKTSMKGICKTLSGVPENEARRFVQKELNLTLSEPTCDSDADSLETLLKPGKAIDASHEACVQYLGVRVTMKDGTVFSDGWIDCEGYIGVKATKKRDRLRKTLPPLCRRASDLLAAFCVMFPTTINWHDRDCDRGRRRYSDNPEHEAFCGLLPAIAEGLRAVPDAEVERVEALGRTFATNYDPIPSLFDEFAHCDETGESKVPLAGIGYIDNFLNDANYESSDVWNEYIEHGWDLVFDASDDKFRYTKWGKVENNSY